MMTETTASGEPGACSSDDASSQAPLVEPGTDNPRGSEISEQLAEGFLGYFEKEVKDSEARISELTHSQNVLIEAIQHENTKFSDCKEYNELTEMMNEAKKYHGKLLTLKKDMKMIEEKSVRLKRRALELQQQKQKKLLQLEQQREREMERERQLTAKHAPKPGALI